MRAPDGLLDGSGETAHGRVLLTSADGTVLQEFGPVVKGSTTSCYVLTSPGDVISAMVEFEKGVADFADLIVDGIFRSSMPSSYSGKLNGTFNRVCYQAKSTGRKKPSMKLCLMQVKSRDTSNDTLSKNAISSTAVGSIRVQFFQKEYVEDLLDGGQEQGKDASAIVNIQGTNKERNDPEIEATTIPSEEMTKPNKENHENEAGILTYLVRTEETKDKAESEAGSPDVEKDAADNGGILNKDDTKHDVDDISSMRRTKLPTSIPAKAINSVVAAEIASKKKQFVDRAPSFEAYERWSDLPYSHDIDQAALPPPFELDFIEGKTITKSQKERLLKQYPMDYKPLAIFIFHLRSTADLAGLGFKNVPAYYAKPYVPPSPRVSKTKVVKKGSVPPTTPTTRDKSPFPSSSIKGLFIDSDTGTPETFSRAEFPAADSKPESIPRTTLGDVLDALMQPSNNTESIQSHDYRNPSAKASIPTLPGLGIAIPSGTEVGLMNTQADSLSSSKEFKRPTIHGLSAAPGHEAWLERNRVQGTKEKPCTATSFNDGMQDATDRMITVETPILWQDKGPSHGKSSPSEYKNVDGDKVASSNTIIEKSCQSSEGPTWELMTPPPSSITRCLHLSADTSNGEFDLSPNSAAQEAQVLQQVVESPILGSNFISQKRPIEGVSADSPAISETKSPRKLTVAQASLKNKDLKQEKLAAVGRLQAAEAKKKQLSHEYQTALITKQQVEEVKQLIRQAKDAEEENMKLEAQIDAIYNSEIV